MMTNNMQAYISDYHHESKCDSVKAWRTNVSDVARQIQRAADAGYSVLPPKYIQDIAVEDAVIRYTKANYGKIGDKSFAHGLVRLIQTCSVRG